MQPFNPTISRRAPAGSLFAELYVAPGPQVIGQTGGNSFAELYGRTWAIVWSRDTGRLHAYQERSLGEWAEALEELPPVFAAPLPAGARRVSAAFDQSARLVVAYEDAAGLVRVTRWDATAGEYVQNVTFAGCDPQLFMDATITREVPGSDVLLFYLSADREKVMCRVQRDIYAVEVEMYDYAAPVILDRVMAASLGYQVLLSDQAGAPLPAVLLSDPYPYAVLETLSAAAAGPTGGAFVQVVIPEELNEELVVGAAGPTGGAYEQPVINHAYVELVPITANAAGPTGGEYVQAIINHALSEELEVSAAGPTGGAYELVVLTHVAGEGVAGTATGPTGGSYDPA